MVNNYIGSQMRFLVLWLTSKVFRSFVLQVGFGSIGFRVQIYGIFVYAAFCFVTFVFFYVSHAKIHAQKPLFYRVLGKL